MRLRSQRFDSADVPSLLHLVAISIMIMPKTMQEQDFQPLPSYSQTKVANASWVNITLTRVDADGTRSQVLIIGSKK